MLKRFWIVGLLLGLFAAGLAWPGAVNATGPQQGQGGIEEIGLASEPLDCLATGPDAGGRPASGEVSLAWLGQARRARLILSISGAEAGHTVFVNGRAVGRAPAYPDGELCGEGQVVYLDLPAEAVVQGQNRIELAADGRPGDTWSASAIRLEVQGQISPAGPPRAAGVSAAAAQLFTFQFTNSYDNKTQEARAYVPASYSGAPTPLLIAVHGRGGDMYFGEDKFGASVNARGWLLASPQLHGHWPIQPSPPGIYAYASVESQYDIAGSIRYMVQHYNVDPARIYLYGSSMGAQTGLVAAAKFPHLFAAVFDNKGPSDMVAWYGEQVKYYGGQSKNHVKAMRQECYVVKSGINKPAYPSSSYGSPTNLFCYQRRSGLNYAGNFIHLPLAVTHSINDALVPISHSRRLRTAIDSLGPDQPVNLYEDPYAIEYETGQPCGDPWHCYDPHPEDVLNFLAPFRRVARPAAIDITTDTSKNYYWLTISQTGGDHWSQVKASYDLAQQTVRATISDTRAIALSINLGVTPTVDIISVPGIGLPAPLTYLVKGGGKNVVQDYTGGALTVSMSKTGQYDLTVSALTVNLTASSSSIPADGTSTTTMRARVRDRLGQAVPDGTTVYFTTSRGAFSNGATSATATTTSGVAKVVLKAASTDGPAQVTARVGYVTGSTSVQMSGQFLTISGLDTAIYLPAVLKNKE